MFVHAMANCLKWHDNQSRKKAEREMYKPDRHRKSKVKPSKGGRRLLLLLLCACERSETKRRQKTGEERIV